MATLATDYCNNCEHVSGMAMVCPMPAAHTCQPVSCLRFGLRRDATWQLSPVVSWLTRQVTGGFTIKTGGLMGLHEGLYVICVDFPFSSLVLSFPYQVLIHMNLRPTKRETNKAVI